MSLKRSALFAFILFGRGPWSIFEWAGATFWLTQIGSHCQQHFDDFRNLMLFRSSDVIKIDHFHSTFLFFPFFSFCCFQWSLHFQWKNSQNYTRLWLFPFQHCLFISRSFVSWWSVVHILKWLAFSFWDLLTIQRHNLISKSKAIQEQRRK